jgi:hypothetical protein
MCVKKSREIPSHPILHIESLALLMRFFYSDFVKTHFAVENLNMKEEMKRQTTKITRIIKLKAEIIVILK